MGKKTKSLKLFGGAIFIFLFFASKAKVNIFGYFFFQTELSERPKLSIAKQLLYKYLWYILHHVPNFNLPLLCKDILIYYCLNEPFFFLLFFLFIDTKCQIAFLKVLTKKSCIVAIAPRVFIKQELKNTPLYVLVQNWNAWNIFCKESENITR